MDQQHWAQYQDNPAATSRQSRYAPQTLPSQLSIHREPNSATLSPQTSQYGATPLSGRSTVSQPQPHLRDEMHYGDRDGDVNMEDADPYKPKHTSLHISHASHQRIPSNVQQEESTAARRYSPMNLSPSSPFTVVSQAPSQSPYTSYTPSVTSSRTSPTRSSYAAPPNNYYASPPSMPSDSLIRLRLTKFKASRPSAPQLPPIQSNMNPSYHPQSAPLTLAPYARDISGVSSPRQPTAPPAPVPKGPVPKFVKCNSISELQPHVNDQPPFRRAKPEGGFLSVSS
jgi:dual specificity protein kinase YAK1